MRMIQSPVSRYRSNLALSICLIIFAALFISGGIFFLLIEFQLNPVLAFAAAELSALGLALIPGLLLARCRNRPRDRIKKKIRMIGEGHLGEPMDIRREDIFPDIAESVNLASRQLSDKLQSIIRNTNRLSDVEQKLTSRFRPRNSTDRHTKELVCQLKICASRLKNDLNDFSLKNGDGAEG